MKLTKEQQLAIDIRDANVLVSAAAGSGKTSVLTQRIISRITDTEDPVDVDRLLVMTFTNAAAEEMRERIRKAIEGSEADPSLIERQSALVHNAMITTIHGFCKSVIADHFEELSLDPNFRVADDNESKLIMQDALDECMENAYEDRKS
ncbi:MAG: UvrD-helicase domain-containing protein, partial [Lachnospiraceae bacterium]|nr:UvrD-helicase domain-containing protein [Lachnospiraceae bacterium]